MVVLTCGGCDALVVTGIHCCADLCMVVGYDDSVMENSKNSRYVECSR